MKMIYSRHEEIRNKEEYSSRSKNTVVGTRMEYRYRGLAQRQKLKAQKRPRNAKLVFRLI